MFMGTQFGEMPFDHVKKTVREAVDRYLAQSLATQPESLVRKVAEYTVLAGGHRWRPMVAVTAGLIFRPDPLPLVLPGACGIELAHAASLILDDLPSMDDAAVRRGKPCPHLVFDRWAVNLAPVLMVTLAYRIALSNGKVAEDRQIQTALALSMAGAEMIYGQGMDLDKTPGRYESEQLLTCYRNKSASLYAAAALTGALSCDGDETSSKTLFKCGLNLGLAYQFLDDIADATATEKETQKSVGRDVEKVTAVDLYGLAGTQDKIVQYREGALSELEGFGDEADHLRAVIQLASWRH